VSLVPVVKTQRLVLREWRDEDLEPFADLNADPRVMVYFPAPLTREQSDSFVQRAVAQWERGLGLWAVEDATTHHFVGFVGLSEPRFAEHFTPAVEIGWRLAYDAQGRGYATEAARAVLTWARENVRPPRGEIVSFTSAANAPSRRVMEKLGFTHDDADDFDHPALDDSPLRRHVLYRLQLDEWPEQLGTR
jgi:RimJ/RimL family protein N-acetyltransferase